MDRFRQRKLLTAEAGNEAPSPDFPLQLQTTVYE